MNCTVCKDNEKVSKYRPTKHWGFLPLESVIGNKASQKDKTIYLCDFCHQVQKDRYGDMFKKNKLLPISKCQ
jgi:hypothetical protein